jgi:hypothetical protein
MELHEHKYREVTMAAEGSLSAAERQALIDRRLDEIDQSLLGLLPRSERLAIVADVEARVQALGDAVSLTRITTVEAPATALAAVGTRTRSRRSRLAFSAGVLGIVAISCLIFSPLLFIGLTIFAELLGETFSIMLFAVLVALVTLGGGLAVFFGGASLFRLARRGQSATGMGWAVTGLCTGALPMLFGVVGLLSVLAEVIPSETVEVSWTAPVQGMPQPIGYPPTAMLPPPMPTPQSFPMPVDGQWQPAPPSYPAMLPPAPPVPPAPPQKAMPVVEPVTKPDTKQTAKPEKKQAAKPAIEPESKPASEPIPPASQEEPVELED